MRVRYDDTGKNCFIRVTTRGPHCLHQGHAVQGCNCHVQARLPNTTETLIAKRVPVAIPGRRIKKRGRHPAMTAPYSSQILIQRCTCCLCASADCRGRGSRARWAHR
jgi:hypothetical protein